MAGRLTEFPAGADRPRLQCAPMKYGRLTLLAALAPACGVPLHGADLRPPARFDSAPVAVTVSAAAASDDLLRPSDEPAGDRSTLVLRLHLWNGSATPQLEEPARYWVRLVGASGHEETGLAVTWGPGELPSMIPERLPSSKPGPIAVAPGQSVTLWVAFRGLEGLPRSGNARVELVLPGPPERRLVVSAPAAAGPRWTVWRAPRALRLQAGTSFLGKDELMSIGMQLIVARGSAVFGMNITDYAALQLGKLGPRYAVTGLGLFGGFLPRDWPGILVGADGLVGQAGKRPDGSAWDDLWMLRTFAAVRFQFGPTTGVGGGVLAVEHGRPSPLRPITLDVGYSYTFARGAQPSRGGLLILAGAPLVSF